MLYSFDHHATGHADICDLQVSPHWAQDYPETDEQLMVHVQEGDEAALGILLYRHIAVCRGIIGRILNDERETELVVQRVFAEVAREAARYSEADGPAAGWIATLARRRAIDRLREKQPARQAAASQVVRALTDLNRNGASEKLAA